MNNRLITLVIVLTVVFVLPLFAPNDPYRAEGDRQLQPPSTEHPFGTDMLGRDVFSRTLHGGARSIRIALAATGLALTIGGALGFAAATNIRWLDRLLSAVIDAVLALPGFVLALVMIALIGTGETAIVFSVGIAQIAPIARVTRAALLVTRSHDYVQAARQLGAPPLWILLRHLLPNSAPTLIAYTGVVFSYALLNGAALAFLGLGGDPAVPDWGAMLYEGRTAFRSAPWVALYPGLAITGVILLTGWALRLNPRE